MPSIGCNFTCLLVMLFGAKGLVTNSIYLILVRLVSLCIVSRESWGMVILFWILWVDILGWSFSRSSFTWCDDYEKFRCLRSLVQGSRIDRCIDECVFSKVPLELGFLLLGIVFFAGQRYFDMLMIWAGFYFDWILFNLISSLSWSVSDTYKIKDQ